MLGSLSWLCNGLFSRGYSGYGGISAMIIGLLVLVLVVYLLFRRGSSENGAPSHGAYESAESILKRRYVNGEIDREEYTEKMEILRKS